jgi:hypothetical protein
MGSVRGLTAADLAADPVAERRGAAAIATSSMRSVAGRRGEHELGDRGGALVASNLVPGKSSAPKTEDETK